ncbi:uncharacterized protein METZ01_LOCUS434596 [marine metagenome]|uniref:Uncharacterized protein n=1 Tax=marine metagenome TaxID=408172 RepID=A0A382YEK1_9ZZZZ
MAPGILQTAIATRCNDSLIRLHQEGPGSDKAAKILISKQR